MASDTDIPKDIMDALAQSGVAGFFGSCTPAHRREYLKWIGAAKRPETRAARIAKSITRLAVKQAEEFGQLKQRQPKS